MAVVAYLCNEHGRLAECDVTDAGERVCPDCQRPVRGLSDGLPEGV